MSPDASASGAPPNMSATTKEMLARVRQMIPPMLEKFHKGVFYFLDSRVWIWLWKLMTGLGM